MINTIIQNNLLASVGGTPPGGDLDAGILKNPILNETKLENLTGLNFLQKFLPAAVGLTLVIGIIFFLFMILLGAIGWISSGGEKASIESARGKITNAIIGIVILLSAFALFKVIEVFFGINILTIDIGPLIIQ